MCRTLNRYWQSHSFFGSQSKVYLAVHAAWFCCGGAMIYISFVDLLAESVGAVGFFQANAAFFLGGMLGGMGILDRVIEHIHTDTLPDRNTLSRSEENDLQKAGLLTAAGIAMHNFPEGIAVLAASLGSPYLGFSVALAIAIHNIPEGIAVSVPIYYASGDRKKRLLILSLQGLPNLWELCLHIFFFSAFYLLKCFSLCSLRSEG